VTGSLQRLFLERRLIILPIAVALVANIAIAAFVVYPSSDRVARAEERERAALQDLVSAQKEFTAANRTQHDKSRAEQDLRRFYTEILPSDLSGARRATYVQLAQLARDAGLTYQRRIEEPREPKPGEQDASSTLARFNITMMFKGDYEGVRQFIRDVEGSDSFIVIDNVGLAQGPERSSDLVLTVQLSTYYRTAASRGH
jgi:Tfp pilus assembly protein PilO